MGLLRLFSRRSLTRDNDDSYYYVDEPPKTIYIPCNKIPKPPKELVRASSISAGVFEGDEKKGICAAKRPSIVSSKSAPANCYTQRRPSVKCRKISLDDTADGAVQGQVLERTSGGNGSRSNNGPRIHHRPFLAMLLLVTIALAAGKLLDGDDDPSCTTTTINSHKVNNNSNKKRGKERGKYLPAFSSKAEGIASDMYKAYKDLEQEYHEKAFRPDNANKWRVVNEKDGAKVSLFEHESDPTCPYVRMETLIPTSVASCWEFLKIENWHWSQPKMDPFYDSHSVHANYTHQGVNMILVRKKTHRILAFGKRDFVFLSVTDLPLADGTWVSGSVSVETPDVPRSTSYTRAFQDSIAFYKPVQDEATGQEQCHLTIVCRIDLNDSTEHGSGGWVPMWLYVKTVGATGIKAVLKMKDALLEMKNTQQPQQTASIAEPKAPAVPAPTPVQDSSSEAEAPTASRLTSFATPPTPSPVFQSSLFTPKNAEQEHAKTDNPLDATTTTAESSTFTTTSWWSRPRGGAFGGSLVSFRPPPTPAPPSKPTNKVDERWKPLYQVFTHYTPKPKSTQLAVANQLPAQPLELGAGVRSSHPSLPKWFRRIPLIGDRLVGGSP